MQISFRNDLESIIFNRPYEGYLFDRILQIVQSKHSEAIHCSSRKGFLCIEHQIEGLDEIYCYETNEVESTFQIECEFIGLSIDISAKLKGYLIENIGTIVIANVYYQACLALCENIENKISYAEEERQIAKKKKKNIGKN